MYGVSCPSRPVCFVLGRTFVCASKMFLQETNPLSEVTQILGKSSSGAKIRVRDPRSSLPSLPLSHTILVFSITHFHHHLHLLTLDQCLSSVLVLVLILTQHWNSQSIFWAYNLEFNKRAPSLQCSISRRPLHAPVSQTLHRRTFSTRQRSREALRHGLTCLPQL